MYKYKPIVLLALFCLLVVSCTKKQEQEEFNDKYYHEIKYKTLKEGGDSDDPPIIITHITDIYEYPIEYATVRFIMNGDTTIDFSNNQGICTLRIGAWGTGDLSVTEEEHLGVDITSINLTDSINQLSIEMYES